MGVRLRGLDRGLKGDGLLLRSVSGEGISLAKGDECLMSNSMESSVSIVGRGIVVLPLVFILAMVLSFELNSFVMWVR